LSWKRRKSLVESVAAALVKAGALEFGTYTLPNGRESSYMISLEELPSFPGAYRAVFDAFLELVKMGVGLKNFDALAGIPIGGLMWSSPIALTLRLPMVSVRKEGRGPRRVEGAVRPGWRVLVIDDLIASGETMSSSCAAVRQEGAEVSDAAVLIDRLEGGRERLAKTKVNLHPLTDILELGDALFAENTIGKEDLKAIVKQVGGRSSRP
jgi:orotate phosphoribosyltransferase